MTDVSLSDAVENPPGNKTTQGVFGRLTVSDCSLGIEKSQDPGIRKFVIPGLQSLLTMMQQCCLCI